MYADDTNIFFSGTSILELEHQVNNYLRKLSAYLSLNKLQLNVSKTKYIVFALPNKPRNYSSAVLFEGKEIEQVTSQKFLGVWFSEGLTWNTHIEKLTVELSKTVGCLYKLSPVLPKWLQIELYYALFYSKMTYGILVWGTTTQTNYQKLLVLQKRVLRAFEQYHGIIRDLKTKPLFEKYALLTITKLYHFKLLQWIKQNKPQCLQNPPDNTHYTMRQQRRKIPAIRTSYGKQHVQYQIPTMLNRLHGLIDFNSVPSNTIIKSILMNHDIEYAY